MIVLWLIGYTLNACNRKPIWIDRQIDEWIQNERMIDRLSLNNKQMDVAYIIYQYHQRKM